jgi:hypothetical protein
VARIKCTVLFYDSVFSEKSLIWFLIMTLSLSLQVKGLTESLDRRILALEKLKENGTSENVGTTE